MSTYYNISGGTPENLLDYIDTLQHALVDNGVLPQDYDFEAHKELAPMQAGLVSVLGNKTVTLNLHKSV